MNAPTRFLSALMQPYAQNPALMLEIRPLWPEWKLSELYPNGEEPPWWWRSQTGRRQWFRLSAIESAATHCLRACGETDVYMGVLPREGRKGGREDVPVAAWLWCDVDGGEEGPEGSVRLVKSSGLPKPHMAVMSGGGAHCVPLDTEILTPVGWKRYHEVEVGDTVLGYDASRSLLDWTRLTGKVIKKNDEVVRVHNRDFSAVCTSGHRWVTHVWHGHQRRKYTENQFTETKDLSRRRHKIVTSARMAEQQGLPITSNEAAIIGWILAEGSINPDGSARLSQSEKKFASEIRQLLKDVPHKASRQHKTSPDMVSWYIGVKWMRDLWSRINMSGNKHEGDWTSFVLNLSSECRKSFLNAFWQGDGCLNRGTRVYIQNPGKISEAVKIAVLLEGHTPRTSSPRGIEVIREGRSFATWDLKVEPAGRADVWCPQTLLGTWVMRQNGLITITGNCYWRLASVEPLSDERARAEFKELLRRLVRAVGGVKEGAHADSTRADTASILRVPDTWNLKRQECPRAVRLMRFQMEEEARSLSWWGATLPAMPLPPERESRPLTPGEIRPLPPKAVSILQSSWPPGTRHTALRELLAIARGCCGFDIAAIELLAETFAAQNAGRREWARKLAQDTCRRIQPSYN